MENQFSCSQIQHSQQHEKELLNTLEKPPVEDCMDNIEDNMAELRRALLDIAAGQNSILRYIVDPAREGPATPTTRTPVCRPTYASDMLDDMPEERQVIRLPSLEHHTASQHSIPSADGWPNRMAYSGEEFSQLNISEEEKDKLVAEVIRYILFKTHQNSGCPIKRDELVQLITKNYHQRSLPSYIINEARVRLSSIFGYELTELQRSRPSSTNKTRASQQSTAELKSYVISSLLPNDVYRKFIEDKDNAQETGLTFTVIAIVQVAGGKISEEDLWHHLRRLGLNENDDKHPVFGNIKQAVETLVQQRYLLKDKVIGPEGNTMMYELAERATDSSLNMRLKEYIAEIASNQVSPAEDD
ncbi:hypothetical protein H6P81_009572 [Aristolochia fimbriata]|uniref:MAGE domain-containing protein n=1 Tax=Aristolochia fimbriata TaxID=158543 RepID=A0AAV7EPR1_ARIFI|nr:hypothetical protein H6P81_009572 [Aristolochia fimbriata]